MSPYHLFLHYVTSVRGYDPPLQTCLFQDKSLQDITLSQSNEFCLYLAPALLMSTTAVHLETLGYAKLHKKTISKEYGFHYFFIYPTAMFSCINPQLPDPRQEEQEQEV